MKPRPRPFREPTFLDSAVQNVPLPTNTDGHPAPVAPERLPLDSRFQGLLLKVLMTDREFGVALMAHVEPGHFDNPTHQWAWATALAYRKQFWGFPTINFLINLAAQFPAGQREVACDVLVQSRDHGVEEDIEAVRHTALEFVRRAVFRKAFLDGRDLYNSGNFAGAYDLMRDRLSALENVSAKPVSRAWVGDGFVDRHIARQDPDNPAMRGIPTAIPELDIILEGGLHRGEVGMWLSRPKAGKTTFLCNLGMTAARQSRKVLHVVLEGNLSYVATRYDAIMATELYSHVKRGDVDAEKYARAVVEAQHIRGLCAIRDFTDGWETSALNIDAELRDLRKSHGFEPDLICVDYADLMRARTAQDSETKHQTEAIKDLKTLANRGHAIWTASQVQRPKEAEFEDVQEVLTSAQIADAYAKVRVVDFLGSINQTRQERAQGVMRLFAELYRDGAAGKVIGISADFSRMTFGKGTSPVSGMPNATPAAAAPPKKANPLGYGALVQSVHGGKPRAQR